jgi:tripartite-type tricarboxylate transporter receptor subunit TctC
MKARMQASSSLSAAMVAKLGLLGSVAALALAVAAGHAATESYPTRPIKLISPFSAGSPPDAFGRLVAQQLTTSLGQSVVVENRPGAGTTIGTKAAAVADPDGYTLVQVNAALSYGPVLYPNPGYDPLKSFAPVASLASWTHVLVAHPSVTANTLQELIAQAKAHPGQLNIGSPLGNPPHVLAEMLKMNTGADFNSVPYRQTPQLITDLLAGRIQLYFAAGEPMISMIKEGKLKAYAMTGARRDTALPDVPTMAEAGLPQLTFNASDWTGILAPAGTRADLIGRLNVAINESLKSAEVKAGLVKLGWEAQVSTPAEFAAFLATDSEKWPPIVKASGLKGD